MASPQGDDDVVDVTIEGERSEEEEKEVENNEEKTEEDAEEQEVVELDSDEEHHEEEEHKQEESEDEVQFVGSLEATSDHDDLENDGDEHQEEGVVIVESGESSNGQSMRDERSRANTDAVMAANGYVMPATLEAELQCIICQYAMFKPVSAICGHSFCRVCLMDSFLTRSIEEAQCPICRVDILQPFSTKRSLASLFSVNVTLWNLVQLLIPSVAERISTYQEEEEQEFRHKLDQLDAKWKVFNLSEQAARYHGDHEEEDAEHAARWEEDHEEHEEYPVVKVENTQEGNLSVLRNIVLDTNDENEDGYVNMRVGFAIVEFPSIFELYNEHQECSVNVIKMEEDEEMADGMPFFMNEDGDDDAFVCGSYNNEISLRVCDEAGNCVMERTRGARGGVVSFPGLRLDVPGGVYTFRFSDDLYGLKLSITTRLREPHEISDTPVADYVGLINDEARDASRRNRRGNYDSDNEEDYDEEGNESDDSFIVDDLNVHNQQPVGRFSEDEGEDQWDYHSDDEAADEEREQRRVRRLQSGRRSERDVQFVEEHEEEELSGEEEHEDTTEQDDVDEHYESDDAADEVRPGRRKARVVEEAALFSEGEADVEDEKDEEQHGTPEVAQPRRRNANQIVDSEDEDEGAHSGSEEEHHGHGVDTLEEHDEHDNAVEETGKEDEEDEEDTSSRSPSRKVKREQWFQGDESDDEDRRHHSDAAFSPGEDVGQGRPRKRARSRQVQIVDEGESDEEEEQMERSIVAANSGHAHDDEDADEDDTSESQFRQVHHYDDEADERLEYEDALQEDEAPDYPDEGEENDYQEDQDDYD